MLTVAEWRSLPGYLRLPEVKWDPAGEYLVLSAAFGLYIMLLLILMKGHPGRKLILWLRYRLCQDNNSQSQATIQDFEADASPKRWYFMYFLILCTIKSTAWKVVRNGK